MTNIDVNHGKDQETYLSFPWETSLEQAQSRWEQAMASYPSVEGELVAARASRSQAEMTRQKIASDILQATKQVCQELIGDAERALEQARYMEAEAERMKIEEQGKVEQAQKTRAEADSYREKTMAEAQQQAQLVLESARSDAERQCMELKQQTSNEVQRILAQAEMLKAVAHEELEAQRIYAEAARLKAESHDVLAQVRGKLGEAMIPEGNGAKGYDLTSQVAERWEDVEPTEADENSDMPSEEMEITVGAKSSKNRKK